MMRITTLIFGCLLLASSLSATTYHVDNTNGACTDGGAGSAGTPWCTLGKGASTAIAGDIVQVDGTGTYDAIITPVNAGSAGNVITFKAATDCVSNNGQTITTPCPKVFAFDIEHDYITVQGFEITAVGMSTSSTVRAVNINAANASILNNYIHAATLGTELQCIDIGGANATITGNNISYCAEMATVFGTVAEPFTITTGVNDKLVFSVQGGANQTVTLTAGSRTAAQINANITAQTTGITTDFGSNGQINERSNTVGPSSAISTVAVANSAYATLGITVEAGTLFGTGGGIGVGGNSALVANNTISHVGDFVTGSAASSAVIRANHLGPIDQYSAYHVDGVQPGTSLSPGIFELNILTDVLNVDNHMLLNQINSDNWIVRFNQTCRSSEASSERVDGGHLRLYNNTFDHNNAARIANGGSPGVLIRTWGTGDQTYGLNNIFNNSTGASTDIYSAENGSDVQKDYDLWQGSADPGETNGINADPQFVGDSTNCNFNLKPTSPAVASGRDYYAKVAVGDSGTGTTLLVDDARWFWPGDTLKIGSNTRTVSAVTYSTGTITVNSTFSRSAGDKITISKLDDGTTVLTGANVDRGAQPFITSGNTIDHYQVEQWSNPNPGGAGTMTITALDANGAVVTTANTTLTFTSSDAAYTAPTNPTPACWSSGVCSGVAAGVLKTAGTQSITVTDGSSKTGTQSGIGVKQFRLK